MKTALSKNLSVSFWILIFVIIANTLTFAQTLSQLQMVEKPTLLTSEIISKEIKDSNGEVCAGLMVVTDMEGLRFDSYNKIVRINSLPGKDLLFLSPSEEVVTVYKSGYTPLQIVLRDRGISLESGKVWQIKITGDKKLDQLPINFIVNVSDFELFIDGKVQEKNKTTYNVPVGSHEVQIKKNGYKTKVDSIKVSSTNTLFRYTLEKIKEQLLTIQSTPDNANIFINGRELGRTNKQLYELPGKLRLKLSKFGYKDYEEEIEVKENIKNEFRINLQKNTGFLVVNVNPSDASIIINDKQGKPGENELEPNRYFIQVSKEGFKSKFDTLEIKINDKIEKSYTLYKNSGSLLLSGVPADAEIQLDGNKVVYSGSIEVSEGRHLLEILCEGYESYKELLSVEQGKETSINVRLIPLYGTLQFTASPIDAEVNLLKNDREIRNWRGANVIDSLLAGNYILQVLSDQYTTKRYEVIIVPDQVTRIDAELVKTQLNVSVKITEVKSLNNLISNAKFELTDNGYTISYDLLCAEKEEFEVSLYLMEKKNTKFEKQLSELSGSVGSGITYGRGLKINWDSNKEFNGGLVNDELYIELRAEKMSGGIPWYVWAGGAVVGGVVAILVGGGGAGSGSGTTPAAIPAPPTRPGN